MQKENAKEFFVGYLVDERKTRCASRSVRIKFVRRHTAGFHYAGTGDP